MNNEKHLQYDMFILEHCLFGLSNKLKQYLYSVFGLRVFGLRNHSIQIEIVHHEFIPQIWWDDLVPTQNST